MHWGYDHWKTAPPDDPDYADEPPEVIVTCEECGGEGAIEEWESVSKWSIDPPCGHCRTCTACGGAGIFIEEATDDRLCR